ncbi:phosphofructokinase [Pontibacillus halophilus JSM 076056 = DSM 19796]|uniref:Tagatose-6-phosphate kinase n=1 Tax=Pontibacillus halophilus JSM 076056 = DSM 19796 TaxID=1385510 RepID=A0A0A5IAL1_9BACI|nr:1-phosphofructokinase [Pontibacillus halophilus]KGX92877.1 phosphofructokinase [Pontibacillus halophilus JSM 076056 = DSM 19796]
MIYTVTLNPSIDYIMHVDAFHEGDLNRAHTTHSYAGGKGINVSRVLKRLNVETTALGYVGGFTGEFIKNALHKEGVRHSFVQIHEDTRINVKLKSSTESEINGPGPSITEEQQQALLQQVEELSAGDYLVVAGSIPKAVDDKFYNQLASICEANKIQFVADTSGKALKDLIGTKTFLLKPNHHELGHLFETAVNTKDDAIYYGRKLVEQGAQHVIVSMGGAGAILITEETTVIAEVPKGEVINSVGAGDSLVSGFIGGYVKTENPVEAFRHGVASGTATAFSSDLCEKDEVERLLAQVHIQEIN